MFDGARDPVPNAALPRAPDHRREEGRRAADVRCPTPGCGRKLAESLTGTLTIRCDRCRHLVTISR
jgi:hypothetical protein